MGLIDKLALKAKGMKEGICNEVVIRQQSLLDNPDDTELMLRISDISLDHLKYLTREKANATPYPDLAEKYIIMALEKGVFEKYLIEKLTQEYKRIGLEFRLTEIISSIGKIVEKLREESTKSNTRDMKVQLERLGIISWFDYMKDNFGIDYVPQNSGN